MNRGGPFALPGILILALITAGLPAAAISIDAAGGVSDTISAADLTAGAGSDLAPVYPSAGNAVVLGITETAGVGDSWRVDVKMTTGTWHGNLDLAVKRNSDGSGGGSVSGGATFLLLSAADQEFFSGAGDRSGIRIHLRLSGVSVQVPPDTYSATVTFTVVDN